MPSPELTHKRTLRNQRWSRCLNWSKVAIRSRDRVLACFGPSWPSLKLAVANLDHYRNHGRAMRLFLRNKGGRNAQDHNRCFDTRPVSHGRKSSPGPDWMPMEQVKAKVMQSGYTQVYKLKADDGRWEGEGIKNGQKMDFHADPKTGAITFEARSLKTKRPPQLAASFPSRNSSIPSRAAFLASACVGAIP